MIKNHLKGKCTGKQATSRTSEVWVTFVLRIIKLKKKKMKLCISLVPAAVLLITHAAFALETKNGNAIGLDHPEPRAAVDTVSIVHLTCPYFSY